MEKNEEKDKRVLALEEKIKSLQARKNSILQRSAEKERKERTRRLIQSGAILEKITGFSTKEEFQALGEYLTKFPDTFEKTKAFVSKRAAEILEENKKIKE